MPESFVRTRVVIVQMDCFEIRRYSVAGEVLAEGVGRVLEDMNFIVVERKAGANGQVWIRFHCEEGWFRLLRAGWPEFVIVCVEPVDGGKTDLNVRYQNSRGFSGLVFSILVGFLVAIYALLSVEGSLVQPILNVATSGFMVLVLGALIWLVARLTSLGAFSERIFDRLRDSVLCESTRLEGNLRHPEVKLLLCTLGCGIALVGVKHLDKVNVFQGASVFLVGLITFAVFGAWAVSTSRVSGQRTLVPGKSTLLSIATACYLFCGLAFFHPLAFKGVGLLNAIDERRIGVEQVLVGLVMYWVPVLGIFVAATTALLLPARRAMEVWLNEMNGRAATIDGMLEMPIRMKVLIGTCWALSSVFSVGAFVISGAILERVFLPGYTLLPSQAVDAWANGLYNFIRFLLGEGGNEWIVYSIWAALCVSVVTIPSLVLLRLLWMNCEKFSRWAHWRWRAAIVEKSSGDDWSSTVLEVVRRCEVRGILVAVDRGNQSVDAAVLDSPVPGLRPILLLSDGATSFASKEVLWILTAHELGHVVRKHSKVLSLLRFLSRWTVGGEGFLECCGKSPVLLEAEADRFAIDQFGSRFPDDDGEEVFVRMLDLIESQRRRACVQQLRWSGQAAQQDLSVADWLRDFFVKYDEGGVLKKAFLCIELLDFLIFNSTRFGYVYPDRHARISMACSMRQSDL